jgi:hypothetical protein
LKDSQTMQAVEPEFGFGEDTQPSTGAGLQRWSLPKNNSFSYSQSGARQSTQPHDGPVDQRSPEPDHPGSQRRAMDRQSVQPNSHTEQMGQLHENATSCQPHYRQIQTPMPPVGYATNGMPEHIFTPQQAYPPPIYVQPYMTPYSQATFRAGSVPPQPTYPQHVYAQSPYPYTIYPQPQPMTLPAPEPDVQANGKAGGEKNENRRNAVLDRIAEHDDKMNEQEIKIKKLDDKLDELVSEVRKVQVSLEEMRSDMGIQQITSGSSTNFIPNFEMVVRAIRAAQSRQEEIRALRDENESMKIRLETIASAMNPLHSSALTSNSLTSLGRQADGPLSLGKRKRDDNMDRRSSMLQHEITASDIESDDLALPEYQLPSSKRRISSSVQPQGLPQPASFMAPTPTSLSREDSVQSHQNLSDKDSIAVDSREDRTQNEDSLFLPGTQENGEQTSESEIDSPSKNVIPEADQDEDDHEVQMLNISEQQPPNILIDQPIATQVDSLLRVDDNSNLMNGIDFSDDELIGQDAASHQHRTSHTAPAEPSEAIQPLQDNIVQQTEWQEQRPGTSGSNDSQQTDNSRESNQPILNNSEGEPLVPRTRGRGRRATDSAVEHETRSMAPEPVMRRSTTARRPKLIDLEDAYVATPDMMALKIQNKGKPRIPKPKVQTTEKQLNKELKSLGLSEWIGKDKNAPEYKQAVDAARLQAREAKRIQKLSERGLSVVRDDDSGQRRLAAQEEAIVNGVGRPVLETSNTDLRRSTSPLAKPGIQEHHSVVAPKEVDHSSTPAPETRGMQTRRKQRAEQIKQRDQMAQEAMEREEMEMGH